MIKREPTWADLARSLWTAGYQRDEYFSFSSLVNRDHWEGQQVWTSKPYPICYWIPGNSEGFYVHVDVGDQRVMVGKFWELARAEEAVTWIMRRLNGYANIPTRSPIRVEKFPLYSYYWYNAGPNQYLMAQVYHKRNKTGLYPLYLFPAGTLKQTGSPAPDTECHKLEFAEEARAIKYARTWAKLFAE